MAGFLLIVRGPGLFGRRADLKDGDLDVPGLVKRRAGDSQQDAAGVLGEQHPLHHAQDIDRLGTAEGHTQDLPA